MDEMARTLAALREKLTAPGAPFELTQVEVGGVPLPAYRNAKSTLPELINAARAHGDKPFIVYQDETWTFARVFAAADALAWALQEQFGVIPGDRIAIAMRNRPEWVVCFLAAALVGAVPAPVNSFGLHDELLAALADVEPRVLFVDVDRLKRLGDDWRSLGAEAVLCDAEPEPGCGVRALSRLTQAARERPPRVQLAPDDPALLMFTSGVTSRAKAVLSTQRAVCQSLMNIDYIAALSAMSSPGVVAELMRRALPPTTLTVVPLFHVSGLHAQLLTTLVNGRKLVFMHRWDPAQALELIQRYRVTQFNGAPAMVMQLIEQPAFDFRAVRGSLAAIGFGGAGLPQRLIGEVLEGLGPSMSGIGFGMTETNGVTSALSGDGFRARPHSSGTVSPIMQVRIADLDDRELPEGETGEIQVRGVTVMREYWRQPEATAAALRGGWLRTGDIGYLESGHLFVVDRLKDVINRAGEKIAAAEVESCLLLCPELLEAAVLAVPDAVHGEAVAAVVVPGPGTAPTEAQLRAFVAERLAAYKVPARILVSSEPLPRTAAGKLLKPEVRRRFFGAT